jgi:hypothetical protein
VGGPSKGQIQFNDGLGTDNPDPAEDTPDGLEASANLFWDGGTNTLRIFGDLQVDDNAGFSTILQAITPTADRVITLPNRSGTVGLVAGDTGQITYNLNGRQEGWSNAIVSPTSGNLTLTTSGTSGVAAMSLRGTWLTGQGTTNTKPTLLVEATSTTSTNWSNSGTGLGVNAPASFGGNLLDLQVNGTSNFNISSTGATLGASFRPTSSTVPTNGMYLSGTNTLGFATNGGIKLSINSTGAVTMIAGQRLNVSGNDDFFLQSTTGAGTGQIFVYRGLDIYTDVAGTYGSNLFNIRKGGTTVFSITNTSNVQYAEGTNLVIGTATGTKIGTATTQKLGFYNAAPVIQPAAVANAADVTDIVAQFNALLSRMRALGLIAT